MKEVKKEVKRSFFMPTKKKKTMKKKKQQLRKVVKKRRINLFRLGLVIVLGLGAISGFIWMVIKFIMLLWGLLSQIDLFPSSHSNEPVSIIHEETTVTNGTNEPITSTDPITQTFEIIPFGVAVSDLLFTYDSAETDEFTALKETALYTNLTKGVQFSSGLTANLKTIEWFGNGEERPLLILKFNLLNQSDQTQTFDQLIEPTFFVRFGYEETLLKEQLILHDQVVTQIYPFQYLVQSYQNKYETTYQPAADELSCHEPMTLEPNQSVTCYSVYDYAGVGNYQLMIGNGSEVYQTLIELKEQTVEIIDEEE